MKNIIKYIGVLSLSALALASCSKDAAEKAVRAISPLDTNKVQVFLFSDTKDVDIKPADGGKFVVTVAGKAPDTIAVKKFPVVFGRHIDSEAQKEAAEVTLTVTPSKAGVFTFDPKLSFAKGETIDTVWVETSLGFGESATLEFAVPSQYVSTYGGASSKKISVAVDYTWIDRGTVFFETTFWGESGDVAIQYAKEYKGEGTHDTDTLFRLVSPYYVTDSGEEISAGVKGGSSYTVTEGTHINFVLDKDYNPVTFGPAPEDKAYLYSTGLVYSGSALNILFAGKKSPYYYQYEYVNYARSNNTFICSAVIAKGSTLSWFETIYFTWNTGCPSVLSVDPAEGEGKIDLTAATASAQLDTKAAIVDPTDATMAQYGVEGSYKLSFETKFTLSADNFKLYLDMTVPYDETKGFLESGTYTFRSQSATAGYTAFAGLYDGSEATGSYIVIGGVLYYLTSGKVVVANDYDGNTCTITVNAISANGTPVKVKYSGAYLNIEMK